MSPIRRTIFLSLLALVLIPAPLFADTNFNLYLGQLEQEYQLPTGILWKVALAESGGRSNVCASTSSACGMFQFIDSTWESDTKALYGQPLSPSLRTSPNISAKAAAYELDVVKNQIGSLITQAKVNLSAGLYLGYFLGSGGARTLLTAYMQNPNQSACSLLPPQCAANQKVLNQSVSGVINYVSQKMQVAGVPNVPGNFQCTTGISYAYSYCDVNASNFLPANTVIPANPYGQYATVFPAMTTGAPLPAPVGATTPFAPAPLSSAPVTTTPTPSTPATGSQCTPQYYCSSGAVYYESSSCQTSVFQTCEYGCSGTVCNAAPSTQSSGLQPTLSQNQTGTAAPSENTSFPSGSLNATSSTIGTPISIVATGTHLVFNSDLRTVVQGELPAASSSTTTSSALIAGITTQGATFEEQTPAPGTVQASYQNISLLNRILGTLRGALTGFLSYLQSLGK